MVLNRVMPGILVGVLHGNRKDLPREHGGRQDSESPEVRGHFLNKLESQCNEDSQESMSVAPIKTPTNGGQGV